MIISSLARTGGGRCCSLFFRMFREECGKAKRRKITKSRSSHIHRQAVQVECVRVSEQLCATTAFHIHNEKDATDDDDDDDKSLLLCVLFCVQLLFACSV